MPGEAYDHLMAVVVLGVIFAAAVFVVPSLSYVNLLYLDQQQLRNVALSALKTILFDEGYPANWGSMHGASMFNESDVQRFGLALLRNPAFYVLDPDKIQRLGNNPMGNISYQRVKDLLGLTGYDFTLTLRPLFKVEKDVALTLSPSKDTGQIDFMAYVLRYDGQPLPNAVVGATVVYLTSSGQSKYETKAVNMETRLTDSLGFCNGSMPIAAPDGWEITDIAVIFRVTVGDRSTVVISEQSSPNPTDVARISLVGDTIIATIDESLPGSTDARWITDITMYNFDSTVNIYSAGPDDGGWGDPDLQGGKRDIWTQVFPWLSSIEPSILIFTFRTETEDKGGRTFALLIGPYSLWVQKGTIQLNAVPASSGAAVSVQRDVIIAGMAYIAELRLWKT